MMCQMGRIGNKGTLQGTTNGTLVHLFGARIIAAGPNNTELICVGIKVRWALSGVSDVWLKSRPELYAI